MRKRQPGTNLTPREHEVLALLRVGLTNEEIAHRLDITVAGAKYHVSEILSKLGVQTREDAAVWHPTPARPWWQRVTGPLTAALRRLAPLTLAKVAIAAGALGALLGLATVALLLLPNADDEKVETTFSAEAQNSLPGGFTVTGAISTSISWPDDFPPNCYEFGDETGTQSFFFGIVSPKEYQVYVSVQPFIGPGSYNAAASPARVGGLFDWGNSAVHFFRLGNDEREHWTATAGRFVVERQNGSAAEGSLDAELAPAGPDAKGPIHISGSWACRHSGN